MPHLQSPLARLVGVLLLQELLQVANGPDQQPGLLGVEVDAVLSEVAQVQPRLPRPRVSEGRQG